MCASKSIAILMRVKHFYWNENMLLLVNLYVRILDITFMHIYHDQQFTELELT